MVQRYRDRVGEIYGNWEVMNYSHTENYNVYWNCKNILNNKMSCKNVKNLLELKYRKDKGPQYSREIYERNRENRIKSSLRYYYSNKEKCAKQKKGYYENNIEYWREYGRNYSRKYYRENKEQCLEATRRWNETHPNYQKEYRKSHKK